MKTRRRCDAATAVALALYLACVAVSPAHAFLLPASLARAAVPMPPPVESAASRGSALPLLRGTPIFPGTSPTSTSAAANISSSIQNVVTQLFATQRAKDCASFVALFADTFSVEDPFGSAPITNASALTDSCEASNKLFTTVTVYPEATYTAGYGAGVIWTVRSITTAGCQLDFTGIDSIVFDSSVKVTSLQGFFDAATAASQMNCSTTAV